MIAALSFEETINFELDYTIGEKQYELSNHLGDVLAVISDWVLPVISGASLVSYTSIVISSQEYSPFGVTLSGRSWSEGYRYGFQNQETDDEMWGGAINYKYRVEDPRLGRFFSVDPKLKECPWNSTYAFSENSLIAFVELEGLEKVYFGEKMVDFTNMNDLEIQSAIDANEKAHRGHLTIHNIKYDFPKSSVWSINSYTRDGIPAGTQFTKYESEADRSNGKVSWEHEYRGPLQTFGHALNVAFGEGSADPGLRGDSMQGEEGLREYSAALGNTGVTLESTVYFALPGALLSAGSTLIDSALDFKNEDTKTAVQNLAIRVAFMGSGNIVKKMVPNNGDSAQEIIELAPLLISNKVSGDEAIKENTERKDSDKVVSKKSKN